MSVAVTVALVLAACGGSGDASDQEPVVTGTDSTEGSTVGNTEGSTEDSADAGDGQETGAVVVAGDAVAQPDGGGILTDPLVDTAIGTVAPTLTGTNFNGGEVTIGPDGRPKAVYFLAHWCSHCQAEVALIQELAAGGSQPAGLDIYAVAIAVNDEQPNYPPSAWLATFPGTVMRDSDTNSAAEAVGVSGIPYTLYLDGDNTIMARSVGSLTEAEVLERWNAIALG